MDLDLANRVYAILEEECGASALRRAEFLQYACAVLNRNGLEFRILGNLGFGGKLYQDSDGKLRVDCYPEDDNRRRRAIIERAMRRIMALCEKPT